MIRVGAPGLLALVGLAACASRHAPAEHPQGPASASMAAARPAQVTRALDGEPPVPGSDTSGWPGLRTSDDLAASPHAGHQHGSHADHAAHADHAGHAGHAGHADHAGGAGAAPAQPSDAGTAPEDAHKEHASHADHAQHRGHASQPAQSAEHPLPQDASRPDGASGHEHVHDAH